LLVYKPSSVLGDSSVIVNWINLNCNLRSIHIEGWKQKTRELYNSFTDIKVQHISRSHNTEADALSKRALGEVTGSSRFSIAIMGKRVILPLSTFSEEYKSEKEHGNPKSRNGST
jgi:hypothetical protein